MRVPAPNFTQTPNDLFDHWLPHLSEGELKVLLVIMRKTFGWHKKRDRISSSQLAKITGLHEETVRICTKSLCEKGVIVRDVVGKNGSQATYYEIVVHEEDSNSSYRADSMGGPGGINQEVSTAPQKKPFRVSNTEPATTKATTTTKESDCVVVSPNSESFELLKAQGFDDKTATSLANFPFNRILRQIRHLATAMDEAKIVNPIGWLRNAIENDWSPPEKKIDPAIEAAELRREQLAERTKVKAECQKLFDGYENRFNSKIYFIIGDDVLTMRSADKHFGIPYDNTAVDMLKTFICTEL